MDKLLRERVQTVRLVTGPSAGESSYWFAFFRFQPERLRVDKTAFVNALSAEGLGVAASYAHVPPNHEWFQTRSVYGTSGLPWSTDAVHFRSGISELWTDRDAEDFVEAIRKVECAYLK